MVLVLNCMKDDLLAQSFDSAISRPLGQAGKKADFLRVPITKEMPDLSKYSHFIISGSEASVLDDNPWEKLLKEISYNIIAMKKPLLAICYGHQFLARALLGKQSVRRTGTPEFGWVDITLTENPLFKGITASVFMVSHYDEVFHLTDDFKVIASSPRCAVHAFQLNTTLRRPMKFSTSLKKETLHFQPIFSMISEMKCKWSKMNAFFSISWQCNS